jgi:hypothetical protein
LGHAQQSKAKKQNSDPNAPSPSGNRQTSVYTKEPAHGHPPHFRRTAAGSAFSGGSKFVALNFRTRRIGGVLMPMSAIRLLMEIVQLKRPFALPTEVP